MRTLGICSLLLLALPAWAQTSPAPATRAPAQIQLTIQDEAGQPVPDATIHWTYRDFARATTKPSASDAHGQAEITRPCPDQHPAWTENLEIQKPGLTSYQEQINLFAGAQIKRVITLPAPQTTRIEFTDQDHKPAPGVPFTIHFTDAQGRYRSSQCSTGNQGEFAWQHPPLRDQFMILSANHQETFADGPLATLTLSPRDIAAALRAAPITIHGRLLLPTGQPAAGWFITAPAADMGSGGRIGALNLGEPWGGKVTPVGADGSFQVSTPIDNWTSGTFVLVSPEGVPILYRFDPASWRDPARKLTITIPPTRQTIHPQVLDEDHKPVPGLPIMAESNGPTPLYWQFDRSQPETTPQPGVWPGVITDAQGRFSQPLPYGTWAMSITNGTKFRLGESSGTSETIEVHPDSLADFIASQERQAQNLPPYKEVIIQFVDDAGHTLDPPPNSATPISKSISRGPHLDVRGQHYYVDANTAQLQITLAGTWRTATKTVPLTAQPVQSATVKLESSLRGQPITGRLLDSEGAPVKDAQVRIAKIQPQDNPVATTSADGTFRFPAAPDDCTLQITRFDESGYRSTLPGWIDPQPVTATGRDLQLKLHPVGSIKILLPPNLTCLPPGIAFKRQEAANTERDPYARLVFDPAAHAMVGRSIRPGTYPVITNGFLPPSDATVDLAPLDAPPITVTANKETLVDWRDRPYPAWAITPWRQATISLTAAAKPFPGVKVAVFTEQASPEMIKYWMNLRGSGRSGGPQALQHLEAVGDAARDLAPTLKDDKNDAIPLNLTGPYPEGNGLLTLQMDLSDDQGNITCQTPVGVECIAIAYAPGRLLGFQRFTLPPQDNAKPITLALQPTRSVRLTATPPNGPDSTPDYHIVYATFPTLTSLERRALITTLKAPDYMMPSEADLHPNPLFAHLNSPTEFWFDDLPVGVDCKLQFLNLHRPDPMTLKIEPGPAPLEVKITP